MKKIFFLLFFTALPVFAQGPAYPYSVVLTWFAPTTGTAPTSYNLYRAPFTTICGTYAVQNTAPITGTSYTDSNVTPGSQYCYEVTALEGTAESGPDVLTSNPVSLPPAPPSGIAATVK